MRFTSVLAAIAYAVLAVSALVSWPTAVSCMDHIDDYDEQPAPAPDITIPGIPPILPTIVLPISGHIG